MKKGIIITILVIVSAAIVYIAVNWPLAIFDNTQGTLGGVKKAEKYKGEQLSKNDVQIKHPEVVKLVQSAEWQNAMRDKDFVKIFFNQDFQENLKFCLFSREIVNNSIKLQEFLSQNDISKMTGDEFINKYKIVLQANNIQKIQDEDISKLWAVAPDIQSAIEKSQADDKNKIVLKVVLKVVLMNTNLGNRILENQNFAKLFALDINKNGMINPDNLADLYLSMNIEKLYNSDIQKLVLLSSDFQKVVLLNSDIQKLVLNNQNFKIVLGNLTFQDAIFKLHANDYNNFLNSQIDKFGLHNIVGYIQ